MKSYPSISTKVDFSKPYFVFDKLDGSNIRAEWARARGFYKFGSRTQLLTPEQHALWPSVTRIQDMGERLSNILSAQKIDRAVCFFEWHGPNSFAGHHVDPSSEMVLSLLDIDIYKRGFMSPSKVLDLASKISVHTPRLLHEGLVTQELLDRVRAGEFPGVTEEGVVGKTAQEKASIPPSMFKHKSQKWYDKLKDMCKEDLDMYSRLS